MNKIKITWIGGKLFLFFSLILIFTYCFSNNSVAKNITSNKYPPEEIPSVIISYNLFASYYDVYKSAWDVNNKSNFLSKLQAEFDALNCDIGTRMAFTHMALIVQSNIDGHFAGINLTKNNAKMKNDNILFTTTPIKTFENKILIILSSVSPARTTIMSVDNMLNVDLLYDSLFNTTPSNLLCPINSIIVEKSGIFKLIEHPDGRCLPSDIKRDVYIDVSSEKFKLLFK